MDKPEANGTDPNTTPWLDSGDQSEVEPEIDAEDGHISKPWDPALIRVDTRQFSIVQVLDMIDDGDLTLQPEFQRRRVWKQEQKSLLIESLLLRIPLPAFYFASDQVGHLQVIDGLQRLSTVHDFVRGGPSKTAAFRLKHLEYLKDIVGGKSYSELQGTVWSKRINQAQIIANIVDPQTPPPVKLNIFTRLNKQGTPLSQQELRHAMSGDRSRWFLSKLTGIESFHEATGGSLKNSPRMHDIELALRFAAFQITPFSQYKYSDSLSDFLTQTTALLDDPTAVPDSQLADIEATFLRSMHNAVSVFDKGGFRKRANNPINRPLFEVWSYILGRLDSENVRSYSELLKTLKSELLLDQEFNDAISLNTGSKRNVHNRFSMVITALQQQGVYIE